MHGASEREVLRGALRDVRATRSTLDALEALLVERARLAKVRWDEIGADLGVTKQSAHRRLRRHDPTPPRRSPEKALQAAVEAFARQRELTRDRPESAAADERAAGER